ncbi:coiled-coil domain-containing protein 126 isoform X1 [Anguilla rostrata]
MNSLLSSTVSSYGRSSGLDMYANAPGDDSALPANTGARRFGVAEQRRCHAVNSERWTERGTPPDTNKAGQRDQRLRSVPYSPELARVWPLPPGVGVAGGGAMLGSSLLRRNMSQKLSALLLLSGLIWGLLLLRYTFQQPGRQSSAQLRQQILELSHRYVRVLSEESRQAAGPQGPSMAGQADLKRTIAILLDDILQRLVKLEGKMDTAVNGSLPNGTHAAGAVPAPGPAPLALARHRGQDTPPRRLQTRRPATPAPPPRRTETALRRRRTAGSR